MTRMRHSELYAHCIVFGILLTVNTSGIYSSAAVSLHSCKSVDNADDVEISTTPRTTAIIAVIMAKTVVLVNTEFFRLY